MHRAKTAEWILSLVTSPERASAIVGDLVEDGGGRGSLGFWLYIFRTTVSIVWGDIAHDRKFMIGLAVRSFFFELWLTFLTFLAFLIPFGLYAAFTKHGGNVPGVPEWVTVSVCLIVGFQVGKWLARRAPGRELAACCAVWLVTSTLGVTFSIAYAIHSGRASGAVLGTSFSPQDIAMFAGAIWYRRSLLKSGAIHA